jgi:hypothetical protein
LSRSGQIATELDVIDILIHLDGHFEHEEAGRVVAGAASGTIMGHTQGAGKTEVHGGAEEPTETAIDIALRRQLNGMGCKVIMRQPPTRGFGRRGGEGLPVVGLVESRGMGDEGVEIKGHELLGRKR